MTQLLDDLRALDALLSDESKWTKGARARTADGGVTWSTADNACCWCLSGALRHVTDAMYDDRHYAMVDALDAACPSATLSYIEWQDKPSRRFADIKALIARAIAAEEGRVK